MKAFIASPTRLAAQAGCGYAWLNFMHSSHTGQEPKAHGHTSDRSFEYSAQPGEGHV